MVRRHRLGEPNPSGLPRRRRRRDRRREGLRQQIKQAERKLDELCDAFDEPGSGDAAEQPLARQAAAGQPSGRRDATILRSAPGLGRGILAILLAEATTLLRERTYQALRSLCGTVPVTKRSGKRCIVVMRQACHVRLRAALYHWARVAIQHDARSRSRYAELRKRGHSHARALRTVADRLLAVACAMLKSQTPFEPQSASLQAAPGESHVRKGYCRLVECGF